MRAASLKICEKLRFKGGGAVLSGLPQLGAMGFGGAQAQNVKIWSAGLKIRRKSPFKGGAPVLSRFKVWAFPLMVVPKGTLQLAAVWGYGEEVENASAHSKIPQKSPIGNQTTQFPRVHSGGFVLSGGTVGNPAVAPVGAPLEVECSLAEKSPKKAAEPSSKVSLGCESGTRRTRSKRIAQKSAGNHAIEIVVQNSKTGRFQAAVDGTDHVEAGAAPSGGHVARRPLLVGTQMAVSDGMTYGWTSPMIPYLQSNASHIPDVSAAATDWLETIVLMGAVTGLPFTILGVNRLGRRKCMILSALIGCACWTALLATSSLAAVFAARFFSGMAGDMCFVAAPMYIAEIADHRIRGFLSAMIYLMMLVGMLLVYTVGALAPYAWVPIIGIGLTACQVCLFPLMPESPYYLVYVGRDEEARRSLKRLRGGAAPVDAEMLEIQEAVRRQRLEPGRLQDLLLIDSNRKALLIMLILNGMQHFVGISVIFMNLHVILNEAGSAYLPTSTAAIVFAVIMLGAATIASAVIDKFGRKVLLELSSLLTGLVLVVIAIYFHLKNLHYDVVAVSWIPAGGVMVYAATFKIGLGLVPIVVTAEIFPTTIKAIGMTIADVIYVLASIISIFVYSALFRTFGMHAPFYLFAVSSLCTTGFVHFFVPETKGKTLDEIQLMLKGHQPAEVATVNKY
ncbi:hypothetical protein YQE_00155, partial [Dendroctonus ponderosae]